MRFVNIVKERYTGCDPIAIDRIPVAGWADDQIQAYLREGEEAPIEAGIVFTTRIAREMSAWRYPEAELPAICSLSFCFSILPMPERGKPATKTKARGCW